MKTSCEVPTSSCDWLMPTAPSKMDITSKISIAKIFHQFILFNFKLLCFSQLTSSLKKFTFFQNIILAFYRQQ